MREGGSGNPVAYFSATRKRFLGSTKDTVTTTIISIATVLSCLVIIPYTDWGSLGIRRWFPRGSLDRCWRYCYIK